MIYIVITITKAILIIMVVAAAAYGFSPLFHILGAALGWLSLFRAFVQEVGEAICRFTALRYESQYRIKGRQSCRPLGKCAANVQREPRFANAEGWRDPLDATAGGFKELFLFRKHRAFEGVIEKG